MIGAVYHIHLIHPLWLTGILLLIPMMWSARRNLAGLGPVRRWSAILLRSLAVAMLVIICAQPQLSSQNKNITVITLLDRSQSIPTELRKQSLDYLRRALKAENIPAEDMLAQVDVAERASIATLPSGKKTLHLRNTSLTGEQSNLSAGVNMALAIAPPNTATRILLVSDGNETGGNLKAAAKIAAANGIPIDVLPLQYQYEREVVFKRLALPARARSGQTISLRFILNSTIHCRGKVFLTLNGETVDLDPDSPALAEAVELEPGTNVKTISLPIESHGMHEFSAVFVPDNPQEDSISANNRATGMTYVTGPGHVLVLDGDGKSGQRLISILENSRIDVRYRPASELSDDLAQLMDIDAIIMANLDSSHFSFQQQEMLKRYVTDMGGGLVMLGGDQSFGAGGWIGSDLAEIIPVDMDPPQKKQMPKGALVLIMHACEIPQGNMWGKRIASAAVRTLGRKDLAGILAYHWEAGDAGWIYPLKAVGDKKAVIAAINNMVMGDMPDFGPHMQQALQKLQACDAAQKHVIIISDGDPQSPSTTLLDQYKQAKITCSGVAINPHSPSDVLSLRRIAKYTGGRFYNVNNPSVLPKIFIKEAQVVRRALIIEKTFTPQISFSLNEIIKGLSLPLPPLDGMVLTGRKGHLAQTIFSNQEGDPVLAVSQAGLGRTAAFTSAMDSRWGSKWLSWEGVWRLWEQIVRWVGKPAQTSDYEVFTDVNGQTVTVNIEAAAPLSNIEGEVITPSISAIPLELEQVGPGQYQGSFQAHNAGSYIINLRHRRRIDNARVQTSQTAITVPFAPEFRDLRDNIALLKEVSRITGGRILPEDPGNADIFTTTGVKFPVKYKPLTKLLLFIWLGLFLLDVAVRRIALDFAAMFRKTAAFVKELKSRRQSEGMDTLSRLQQARHKLRQQLSPHKPGGKAAHRYTGGEYYEGKLEITRLENKKADKQPTDQESKKTKKEDKDNEEAQTHIEQLLKAKRKARRKDKDA